MRHRANLVPIALLAVASLGGVCDEPCDLPHVQVASPPVQSGSISFRKGATAGEEPLVDHQASLRDPNASSLEARIGSSVSSGGAASLSSIYDDPSYDIIRGWFDFSVHEQFTDAGLSVSIFTSDPRRWEAGEVPLAELAPRVTVWSFESCSGPGSCTVCTAEVPQASVRAFVEDAVGGVDEAAREMVSPDFRRTIRLEVDLGGPVTVRPTQEGKTCSLPIEATATATFTWDQSHFVFTDGC